jgi:hypothetical protein
VPSTKTNGPMTDISKIRARIAAMNPDERYHLIEGDWRGHALEGALHQINRLEELLNARQTAVSSAKVDNVMQMQTERCGECGHNPSEHCESTHACRHGDCDCLHLRAHTPADFPSDTGEDK